MTKKIIFILKIAVAAIFASHGILALTLKQEWFKYLETISITGDFATTILQAIGIIDILVAVFALVKPYNAVLVWAIIWAFATALIRPISGESWLEFFERAGNWACPLVLLLLQRQNNS